MIDVVCKQCTWQGLHADRAPVACSSSCRVVAHAGRGWRYMIIYLTCMLPAATPCMLQPLRSTPTWSSTCTCQVQRFRPTWPLLSVPLCRRTLCAPGVTYAALDAEAGAVSPGAEGLLMQEHFQARGGVCVGCGRVCGVWACVWVSG